MKTTMDLPNDLLFEIKLKAVQEGRKLKDAVADLLRRGLAAGELKAGKRATRKPKVTLPLVRCRHAATAATEMTPERVAELLLLQEASWHDEAGR